jgi:hypothetical protein
MEGFAPLYETFGVDLAGSLILGQIATLRLGRRLGLDTYKAPWKEWLDGRRSTIRYVVYRDALMHRLEGQRCCRLGAFTVGDGGRACHQEFDSLLQVAAWLCQWEPSRSAVLDLAACICIHTLTPELRLRLRVAVRRFCHLCDEREQKAMLTAIQRDFLTVPWRTEASQWQPEWQTTLQELSDWVEERIKKLADVSFPETMSMGPVMTKNADAQPGPELLSLLRELFPLA